MWLAISIIANFEREQGSCRILSPWMQWPTAFLPGGSMDLLQVFLVTGVDGDPDRSRCCDVFFVSVLVGLGIHSLGPCCAQSTWCSAFEVLFCGLTGPQSNRNQKAYIPKMTKHKEAPPDLVRKMTKHCALSGFSFWPVAMNKSTSHRPSGTFLPSS